MGFTAEYIAAAALQNFNANYYISIAGISTKFSKKAVSGITTEQNLMTLDFNPSKISLDNVQTTIGSLKVALIDPSGTLLTAMQTVAIHEQLISLYVGFTDIAGNKYQNLANYRINEIKWTGTGYVISATDSLKDLAQPYNLPQSPLSADIDDLVTTIPLVDTTDLPTAGTGVFGKAGDTNREAITWTGKTSVTLTGATRGANGSTASPQKTGSILRVVKTVTATNPVTMLLQLMVSPGGGGTYDVLDFGLGLDHTRLAESVFEAVRDGSNLTGQVWTLELIDDLDSFLKFVEQQILFFTNTRMFTDVDGLISYALVEQITVDSLTGDLTRADVLAAPESDMDSKRLYNRVTFKWDFNYATGEYQQIVVYEDADSQAAYGVVEKNPIECRGIRASLDGANVMSDFATRLLRRVAFPVNRYVKLKTTWAKQFVDIGAKMTLTHDQVVDLATGVQGVTLQVIEVLEKKWDFDKGTVEYITNASELLSEAWVFISPASWVVSGASHFIFTVKSGEGVKWTVGWVIALWLRTDGNGAIATATITDVTGDVITVDTDLTVTPGVTHMIVFADEDQVTTAQKLYGFVSHDDGSDFADGHAAYLISD